MRYHGISPLVSALYREKRIEAKAYTQRQAFDAAIMFARAEGFIPSPESSYAIKAVVDEAIFCKNEGGQKNILFLLSTNSNLDITTFKNFLDGVIEDKIVSEKEVQEALERLPKVKQE
jgi:tryptophan synthase beta chain